MARMYDEKPSQRRSGISPRRNNTTTNFRERSNDRSQRIQTRENTKIIGHKVLEMQSQKMRDSINKEQNERGRKLEQSTVKSHSKPEGGESENTIEQEEDEMMKLMGFGSFDTTKNKKVEGQVSGAVKKNKKTEFRQYMNREKGFNRALSPGREKKYKPDQKN